MKAPVTPGLLCCFVRPTILVKMNWKYDFLGTGA
jgi:hypothetical protein